MAMLATIVRPLVKRLDCAITVAGIQSLDAYLGELPRFDLILIDECDLVPPGDDSDDAGRYWRLLNSQPQASVVGFTATPWRTREGKLTWGALFMRLVTRHLWLLAI